MQNFKEPYLRFCDFAFSRLLSPSFIIFCKYYKVLHVVKAGGYFRHGHLHVHGHTDTDTDTDKDRDKCKDTDTDMDTDNFQ
jgi:hypothetical protein